MKPGLKTTEFWVSAITTVGALAGSLAGVLPGTAGVIAASIAAAAYALSRGLAKVGDSGNSTLAAPTK